MNGTPDSRANRKVHFDSRTSMRVPFGRARWRRPSQQIQPSDVESSRMSMANVEPEPMMSGRANNACAANGTNCNAFTFGHMIGPPAENA